jgi:Fur family ferric uptake transcriptional regulator
MSDPYQKFETTLKNHGQSLTAARSTVFKALQNNEPQSMADLAKACLGEIDRTSIYRTVALFERLGIVKKLPVGWKYKLELSDDFQRHHHHLTCLNCGRVIALPEDRQLEAKLHSLAGQHDFVMKDHVLEIQGLCADCRPA